MRGGVIPGATRDYVRRALTFLWIYADRMHLPSPSLDALAAGHWPRFSDEARSGLARRHG